MKFEEKKIILKNNNQCILRSPRKEDSVSMIEYLKKISSETDFMIRYEEEVTITLEQEEKFLESCLESKSDIMISAFIDDKIIGNIGINIISDRIKLKHRSNMGIGIIKDYWGLGLGNILIKEALNIAENLGYEQIELTVAEKNDIAINLYEKYGFEVYGVRKNGTKFKDGTYDNDILMIKYLN